uniref:Homeotic protein spalt-major n=2 Tax=Cacopsylla melanoneura TaxID=428564 RepID=A0A8D8QHV3_9HEMI
MSRRKQSRPIRVLEDEELENKAPRQEGEVADISKEPLQLDKTSADINKDNTELPSNTGGDSVSEDSDEDMCSTEDNTSDHRIEEELTCRFCQEIFPNFSELLEHKKDCASRNRVVFDQQSAPSEEEIEEEEPEEIEDCGKRKEEVRRQKQDAENNNSVDDGETEGEEGELPLPYPFPIPAAAAPGHVTLEALQNTKVAVAQFAATALANGTDNPAALQELAVLQSTLYTLQHQQILQLNLIQQLQDQLQINRPPGELAATSPPPPPVMSMPLSLTVTPPVTSTPAPLNSPHLVSPSVTPSIAATRTASPPALAAVSIPPKPSRSPTPIKQEPLPQSVTPPASQSIPATNSQPQTVPIPPRTQIPHQTPPPPPPSTSSSLPHCSISSSFASSIITNLDPSSPNEPNTLEMLQRRAQEVLDNASQGLLANNLADELAFRKNGGKGSLSPYDSKSGRNEPFFKHRCRYCGKVFGSDSALQIHIRSHTGERPFKCNVCGSRFTTKGNLKVHFQRHTSKFPHIKMNPHPVPEHLDKYHPPLLAQINSQPPHHPHPPYPTSPPYPSSGLPMFRPSHPSSQHELVLPPHHPPLHRPHEPLVKPLLPMPLFSSRERNDQDMPENLSKPVSSIHSSPPPSSDLSDKIKRESIDEEPLNMSEASGSITNENMSRLSPKTEPDVDGDSDHDRYQGSPPPYDGCSVSSKYSTEDMMIGDEDSGDESLTDQPENLSNKRPLTTIAADDSSNSPHQVPSFSTSLAALENQVRTMSTTPPPPAPINGTSSPYSMTPSPPVHLTIPRPLLSASSPESSLGAALDLTPRSGSGIFSGIGLVTSVNSPISQYSPLGLAVGPAVRGGNTTCNICFKTFACHSALEIHYRSHTKERPFKCNMCDRGFSTKGNMKQHMLTHKIRDMPSHLFHNHSQDTKSSSGILSTEENETSNASSVDSSFNRSTTSETHKPDTPRQSPSKDTPLSLNLSNSSQPSRSQPHTPQSHPPPSLSPPTPTPLSIPQPPPSMRPSLSPPVPVKPTVELSPHPPPPPPQVPSLKRTSPPEDRDNSSVPLPKRHPSMPKHLCHVCHKNFSSSSALQIHMRTHTGDKPFRCTICQKAFTTKGNLKVHMGTHMWTNGASRRGRRMSLDLPPHLTPSITPKEPSEYLHRRPDLFYPYLPAPFLNGMQQKLNEISVIQNVTSNMSNGLINFTSTFGTANLPESLKRSMSPLSDKPLSPGAHHRGTSPLWEIKQNGTGNHSDDQIDVCPSPRLSSQREGLAA